MPLEAEEWSWSSMMKIQKFWAKHVFCTPQKSYKHKVFISGRKSMSYIQKLKKIFLQNSFFFSIFSIFSNSFRKMGWRGHRKYEKGKSHGIWAYLECLQEHNERLSTRGGLLTQPPPHVECFLIYRVLLICLPVLNDSPFLSQLTQEKAMYFRKPWILAVERKIWKRKQICH